LKLADFVLPREFYIGKSFAQSIGAELHLFDNLLGTDGGILRAELVDLFELNYVVEVFNCYLLVLLQF